MRTRLLPSLSISMPLALLLLSNLSRLADARQEGGSDSNGHSRSNSETDSSGIRRARTLWVDTRSAAFAGREDASAGFTSVFGGQARQDDTRRSALRSPGTGRYPAGGTRGTVPLGSRSTGDRVGRWFPLTPTGNGGATAAVSGYQGGVRSTVPPAAAAASRDGWVQLTTEKQPNPHQDNTRDRSQSYAQLNHNPQRDHGNTWYRVQSYPAIGTHDVGVNPGLTLSGYQVTGYPNRHQPLPGEVYQYHQQTFSNQIGGGIQQSRGSTDFSQTQHGGVTSSKGFGKQKDLLPYEDIYLQSLRQDHATPGYYYRKTYHQPSFIQGSGPITLARGTSGYSGAGYTHPTGYGTSLTLAPGLDNTVLLRLPPGAARVSGPGVGISGPSTAFLPSGTAGPLGPSGPSVGLELPLDPLCPDQHTCSADGWWRSDSRDSLSWAERGCMCDASCSRYGDCCSDTAGSDSVPGRYSCRPVEPLSPQLKPLLSRDIQHWYMRDSCPLSAAERGRCEQPPSAEEDPLSSIPVTSRDSGVTYRNYHCALCHGDAARLTFWRVQTVCPSVNNGLPSEEVAAGLRRGADGGWLLQMPTGELTPCQLTPQPPADLRPRACAPTVSQCLPGAAPFLEKLCYNHTAVVYSGGRAYRNIYCLRCAGGGPDVTCSAPCPPPEPAEVGPVGLRVRLELRVGADLRCSASDLWDPFTRRCRSVACGSGQRLLGARCVSDAEPPTSAPRPPVSATHSPPPVVHRPPPLPPPTTSRPLPPLPPPSVSQQRLEPPSAPSPQSVPLAPADDLQVIMRLLVRTQNDLVRSRDGLVKNRDRLIHNRDASSDEEERQQLLDERAELVEHRNNLLVARRELLKRRKELLRQQGSAAAENSAHSDDRYGVRRTRRPYHGGHLPARLSFAEYGQHQQPGAEVDEGPDVDFQLDFGDPDGILGNNEGALGGINDLLGASSVSADVSSNLGALTSAILSSLQNDDGPETKKPLGTGTVDTGADLAAGSEDAAQRYSETQIGLSPPPISDENPQGSLPDSVPQKELQEPLGARYRGAGRQGDLWAPEGSGLDQEAPPAPLSPGDTQGITRVGGRPRGVGWPSAVENENDGYGDTQVTDPELYDYPYNLLGGEPASTQNGQAVAGPGSDKRFFASDPNLYETSDEPYGNDIPFYGDENELLADELATYDTERDQYPADLALPGGGDGYSREPRVSVPQGNFQGHAWKRGDHLHPSEGRPAEYRDGSPSVLRSGETSGGIGK